MLSGEGIGVLLRRKFARHPGSRRIDETLFSLTRFKSFIRRAIERLRGVIDVILAYISLHVLKL